MCSRMNCHALRNVSATCCSAAVLMTGATSSFASERICWKIIALTSVNDAIRDTLRASRAGGIFAFLILFLSGRFLRDTQQRAHSSRRRGAAGDDLAGRLDSLVEGL